MDRPVHRWRLSHVWSAVSDHLGLNHSREGNHTISVKAFDRGDSVVGSESLDVSVQNGISRDGVVRIAGPANGARLSGSTMIATEISPGVSWTDLYIDGDYLS